MILHRRVNDLIDQNSTISRDHSLSKMVVKQILDITFKEIKEVFDKEETVFIPYIGTLYKQGGKIMLKPFKGS